MKKRHVALVDPSEELVMVANTFVSWYKLFRRTNPPNPPEMCGLLQHRQTGFWACLALSFHTKTRRGD